MPTQAEVRRARNILNANIAHGLGGPKGFSKQDWARMAAAIPDWQGTGKSGGSGALDAIGRAFKSGGSAALNALSVPQAVLFTTMSKVVEGATGNKGMDWSDMLGGFSDDYKGFSELLTQTNRWDKDSGVVKWGGLLGDIALDPLWFVTPAKVARTPSTVAKLANAGVSGTRATADVAKAISKDAGTTAMLGKFGDASNAGKSVAAAIKAQAASVTVKKGHRVTVSKGVGGAEKTDSEIGSAVGDLVNGRYFIYQTKKAGKKAGGDKAAYRIFDLGDDATVLRSTDRPVEQVFKNKTEARDFLKEALAEGDGVKYTDRLVNMMDEGVANLDDYARGIQQNIDQAKGIYDGGANRLGIKFGYGKTNPTGGKGLTGKNFVLDTKIPLPSNKTLGAVSGLDKLGSFRRSPFEKSVHQASRSGNEMANAAGPMWDGVARESFGLTDEQAKLAGIVGTLDNMSHPGIEGQLRWGGDYMVTRLKERGLWTEGMERSLAFTRERMAKQRSLVGKGDKTWRGAEAEERALNEFLDGVYEKVYKKAIEGGGSKAKAKEKAEAAVEKAAEKYKGRTRGEYILQTPTRESLKSRSENAGDVLTAGRGSKTMRNEIREQARKHTTALNYITKGEFEDELVALGLNADDANKIADDIEGAMSELAGTGLFSKKQSKTLKFADEAGELKPEFDIMRLGAFADRRFVRQTLMQKIDELAEEAGLGTFDDAGELVFTSKKQKAIYDRAMRTMDGGILAKSVGWNKYLRFVGGLKMYLTSMQPQHYTANTFGDWFKDFVEGNWRHLKFPTASIQFTGKKGVRATKGSKHAKMASADTEALKSQRWVIGGNEYTGEEIFFLSHMVGLGKGYAGDEILNITRLYEEAGGVPGIKQWKQYVRWSARQNATREDATRIQAWMKWMEGGDDPMTAGLKTVRSHFDYSDLTDFEKVFLRNFILFYTWSRKNIPYQFKSIARRPGLYSAYGDIERDRPKMPYEPDYLSEMGLLPIPGLGSFQMFAPHADMHRVPLSPTEWPEAFRRNVMGATPPPLKQIMELGTNKDFFTGAPLPAYPGQTKEMFGKEMPWWAAYAAKQAGPLSSQANRITDDRINSNVLDILGSITGVGRRVKPDPKWQQWAATQAAKRAQQGG